MNKRIKKKRRLETLLGLAIGQITALRLELDAVKSATLDNQAAIKSIGDDVDYIKQNYKRKWGKNKS
ncbi:hypothetical protein I6J14_05465 [Streptococcus dysgalactiae]|uniref:hypothetical protein n=1 Tax=Streptococcus dysgalactiae TaxID=1334 RepID=UPI000651023E|nr:hypothetical protein [Streptococcus dysgalactiae]QQT02872.1 hypothetical protein I6J14_05465 [Streptococcus dysgalactiae]SUN44653.1 phage protein [Streptococcus dysgalactiae subsp. dysgalactiae]SUN49135.1 phage protein [Streptococcus dysgalactiae]SUN54838.1 phage protein [Streptococcus dysgalactiae]VTT18304.1 phage protein [Streptococcus dysgalactiae subsp. equisimilis]